jgi:hypothetical protein
MGEHKLPPQLRAAPPVNAVDLFNAISEKLEAARKPVQAAVSIAPQLPAGAAFMTFAILLETAMNQYNVFLEVSAQINEARARDAQAELEKAPAIVTP